MGGPGSDAKVLMFQYPEWEELESFDPDDLWDTGLYVLHERALQSRQSFTVMVAHVLDRGLLQSQMCACNDSPGQCCPDVADVAI